MLNGFCSSGKNPTPLVLMDNIKVGGISTKIKWKMHTPVLHFTSSFEGPTSYEKLRYGYVITSYFISCFTSTGFEVQWKSASLTLARTYQNHYMRVISDLHQSFVRLLSNDNFHNNLLLDNSNTLIFHFFWQTESVKEIC